MPTLVSFIGLSALQVNDLNLSHNLYKLPNLTNISANFLFRKKRDFFEV